MDSGVNITVLDFCCCSRSKLQHNRQQIQLQEQSWQRWQLQYYHKSLLPLLSIPGIRQNPDVKVLHAIHKSSRQTFSPEPLFFSIQVLRVLQMRRRGARPMLLQELLLLRWAATSHRLSVSTSSGTWKRPRKQRASCFPTCLMKIISGTWLRLCRQPSYVLSLQLKSWTCHLCSQWHHFKTRQVFSLLVREWFLHSCYDIDCSFQTTVELVLQHKNRRSYLMCHMGIVCPFPQVTKIQDTMIVLHIGSGIILSL